MKALDHPALARLVVQGLTDDLASQKYGDLTNLGAQLGDDLLTLGLEPPLLSNRDPVGFLLRSLAQFLDDRLTFGASFIANPPKGIPMSTSLSPILYSPSTPIERSQASTMTAPPAIAWPLTSATVGAS